MLARLAWAINYVTLSQPSAGKVELNSPACVYQQDICSDDVSLLQNALNCLNYAEKSWILKQRTDSFGELTFEFRAAAVDWWDFEMTSLPQSKLTVHSLDGAKVQQEDAAHVPAESRENWFIFITRLHIPLWDSTVDHHTAHQISNYNSWRPSKPLFTVSLSVCKEQTKPNRGYSPLGGRCIRNVFKNGNEMNTHPGSASFNPSKMSNWVFIIDCWR